VPDGREKLLVPGTKQNGAALFQKSLPFFFINDGKPEGQAVNLDKIVNKNNKGSSVYDEL